VGKEAKAPPQSGVIVSRNLASTIKSRENIMHRIVAKAACAAVALLLSARAEGAFVPANLPPPTSTIGGIPVAQPYGDAYSYNLPFLNALTGTSNYSVASAPGQIKDLVVVLTGASGQDLNENAADMNNAYPSPSGRSGSPSFSTISGDAGYPGDPGGGGLGSKDSADSWDATLLALRGVVPVNRQMLFYFNFHQEGSGFQEDLFAWAQVKVWDSTGNLAPRYYDMTNDASGPSSFTSPGPVSSSTPYPDPFTFVYNTSTVDESTTDPHAHSLTDWVWAPGNIPFGGGVDANLGANDVSYVVWVPELQQLFDSPNFGGYNMFSLTLKLGHLNGGYEQLFIGPGTVPLPQACWMGLGLLGVYGIVAARKSRAT